MTYLTAQVKFKEVGCFKDAGSSRALPTLVANLRGQIDWLHMEKTVEACAELVHKKGWPYFGLQFYGECWSGANGNYSKYGKSNDCWSGVGKINANYVYEMNSAGEVSIALVFLHLFVSHCQPLPPPHPTPGTLPPSTLPGYQTTGRPRAKRLQR